MRQTLIANGSAAPLDGDAEEHQRTMEDQWMEGLTSNEVTIDASAVGVYITLLQGCSIGFFIPFLPFFFFRTQIFSKRMQMAIVLGSVINVAYVAPCLPCSLVSIESILTSFLCRSQLWHSSCSHLMHRVLSIIYLSLFHAHALHISWSSSFPIRIRSLQNYSMPCYINSRSPSLTSYRLPLQSRIQRIS